MGWLERARRGFRRLFPSRAPSRRAPKKDQFFGPKDDDERYESESGLPSGWRIECTFPDRHAVPDFYNGGPLPSYMGTLSGRVVVSYTHSDGHKTFRTIHGPIPDMERLAQLIAHTGEVSPT